MSDDDWARLQDQAWQDRVSTSELIRTRALQPVDPQREAEATTRAREERRRREVSEVSGHTVTLPPEVWARWSAWAAAEGKSPADALPILLTQSLDAKAVQAP